MAKMIDDIRERLLDHVLSLEEIDSVLEENKYLPIETDEDDIEGNDDGDEEPSEE